MQVCRYLLYPQPDTALLLIDHLTLTLILFDISKMIKTNFEYSFFYCWFVCVTGKHIQYAFPSEWNAERVWCFLACGRKQPASHNLPNNNLKGMEAPHTPCEPPHLAPCIPFTHTIMQTKNTVFQRTESQRGITANNSLTLYTYAWIEWICITANK